MPRLVRVQQLSDCRHQFDQALDGVLFLDSDEALHALMHDLFVENLLSEELADERDVAQHAQPHQPRVFGFRSRIHTLNVLFVGLVEAVGTFEFLLALGKQAAFKCYRLCLLVLKRRHAPLNRTAQLCVHFAEVALLQSLVEDDIHDARQFLCFLDVEIGKVATQLLEFGHRELVQNAAPLLHHRVKT
eukprot:CAMPEP_0179432190 /NCGR_PEP_ID=MMETSP0799-20121207/16872_1 /TAXON_ID=46947 /ORGANISM="Geminigera cryophila, Strain CCMP2564" /LENGTH=187 /DNA_ID=CAMNT_0021209457 /DNA_START=1536 /DNA_END=2099 /DNA_ORIENTATION=-